MRAAASKRFTGMTHTGIGNYQLEGPGNYASILNTRVTPHRLQAVEMSFFFKKTRKQKHPLSGINQAAT